MKKHLAAFVAIVGVLTVATPAFGADADPAVQPLAVAAELGELERAVWAVRVPDGISVVPSSAGVSNQDPNALAYFEEYWWDSGVSNGCKTVRQTLLGTP